MGRGIQDGRVELSANGRVLLMSGEARIMCLGVRNPFDTPSLASYESLDRDLVFSHGRKRLQVVDD